MMTDFLLELRSEEIPARMQDEARHNLREEFDDALHAAGITIGSDQATTYCTPRRLALIIRDLPLETPARVEETKGPKTSAPPQALEGFLRKTGLTQDQLVDRDGVYFAVVEKPGRQTADVLAQAIPAIIRAFPWPKSQRWGAASISTESLRWVRPLQGIVALLGDDVVECEIDGIASGSATLGHRFHHPGAITIGNAGDYAAKLRACHVIVDQEDRRAIIREGAAKVAADAGLVLVPDEGLVNENSGLTEWPVPMLGRFDPAFLAVPEEVIQLTARVNQKYFVCKNPPRNGEGDRKAVEGPVEAELNSSTLVPAAPGPSVTLRAPPPRSGEDQLANAFVCTANIVASDGGAVIVAGNEKVLAARLSDAKFFWEQDLKVRLEDQAKKLSSIVFHEKLGTVADKVERVAKLARWLVESGVIVAPAQSGASAGVGSQGVTQAPASAGATELANQAERAARLCKADLVTGMVGEFPELQGIMGGYYARAQGEAQAVADAVRDHYKPVGQGDDVPTAPVTVAVSLADKLDTIVGFFAIGEKPSGSRDPFAIRRAMIAVLTLIFKTRVSVGFKTISMQTLIEFNEQYARYIASVRPDARQIDDFAKAEFTGDGILDQLAELQTGLSESALSHERIQKSLGSRLLISSLNDAQNLVAELLAYAVDRLKVQQREAGVRHDLIDAVFALGGEDDLVRLLARVKALQGFVGTADGVNLLAGYKRAANILKGTVPSGTVPDQAVLGGQSLKGQSPAELALLTALNTAETLAAAAIEAEDFEAAMSALASLRAPIDAFFEGVMVNDPDPQKRAFRLGLLARFRDAVHRVADFSKIEG